MLAGLVGTCWAAGATAAPAPVDTTLAALRAARRADVRAATAAATAVGRPARLTLLVIPVDFADHRLPADWDPGVALGARLSAVLPTAFEGAQVADAPLLPAGSLWHYFRVASCGRADLDLVLAPLVRLAAPASAYSDRWLAGATRTRRLAQEALEGAREAGIAFSRLDNDGPDGFPGTGDDDGELDGALILHNEIGDENDAQDGLIQALQYYLEGPVTDRGTLARLYAVASLHSELGVWAHEAAHLLGLEDRYDPFLPVTGSEVAGRGGLGVFSLMAAGAFGFGGRGPALPDAYSCAQLGWRDVVTRRGLPGAAADTLRPPPTGAQVWRVWTRGEQGAEYFLLETRGDPAAGLYDQAGMAPGELLVLHVDESLPERAQSSLDPDTRHLRVRLLEADGDGTLAEGLDAGGPSDCFPNAEGADALTPDTIPASSGYGGPTEVSLTDIAPSQTEVACVLRLVDSATPACLVTFAFEPAEAGACLLRLGATETGVPIAGLFAEIAVTAGQSWGSFAGGALSVSVPLLRDPATLSWSPAEPPVWYLAAEGGEETALTQFAIRLTGEPGFAQETSRSWLWSRASDPLDFAGDWPQEWTIEDAGSLPGTTWHRWSDSGVARADGGAALACTGTAYVDAGSWPLVSYANGADITLMSGPLPPAALAVRLIHSMHGELVRPGIAFDGGVVEFLLPDGSVAAAQPVDGYDGRIAPQAACALHDRPAFAAEDSLGAQGEAIWRADVFLVPRAGAGPVRLRLRFASDTLYRGRGWLVASLQTLTMAPQSAFPVAWEPALSPDAGGDLVWNWPGQVAASFHVEVSEDNGATWLPGGDCPALPESGGGAFHLAAATPGCRRLARVLALTALGPVASRPVVAGAPRSEREPPPLGLPYPNPSAGAVRVMVELPTEARGRLWALDLRGRRVREWPLAGGARLLAWDGLDGRGQRVAAGLYLFHLEEAGGRRATRKVVVLP